MELVAGVPDVVARSIDEDQSVGLIARNRRSRGCRYRHRPKATTLLGEDWSRRRWTRPSSPPGSWPTSDRNTWCWESGRRHRRSCVAVPSSVVSGVKLTPSVERSSVKLAAVAGDSVQVRLICELLRRGCRQRRRGGGQGGKRRGRDLLRQIALAYAVAGADLVVISDAVGRVGVGIRRAGNVLLVQHFIARGGGAINVVRRARRRPPTSSSSPGCRRQWRSR